MSQETRRFRWTVGGLVLALLLVYLPHFDNGFYFDDVHTIVGNEYIRSLDYLPDYFTDIATFGTMPNNRGYRPMVTLLNAIDYQLAGRELDPRVFHATMFFWYLVLGALLLVFTQRAFEKVQPQSDLRWVALGTTALYLFHTANAETINYIISRSDSFSTLCVVATLLVYQWPRGRRWGLYLAPLVVGMLTKEVTFMVVPLIGLYHLLFEEQWTLSETFRASGWRKLGRAVLWSLPALVVGMAMLYHNLVVMTNPSRLVGGLAHPRWDYFTSQWVVVSHYLLNFVAPLDLCADPDFKVTAGLSGRKFAGLALIGSLHLAALVALRRVRTAPIAFGLLWFFVCLVPTSTINPLYQVANDHRTFLPYIGLCWAAGWAAWLAYQRCGSEGGPPLAWRRVFLPLFAALLLAHAVGVVERCRVWGSNETLWADTVAKAPENGRALMNYGLVKMGQGRYQEAQTLFERSLRMLPTWPYVHVNLAIVHAFQGHHDQAQTFFLSALRYGADNPEPYYYYARWLRQQGRLAEALELAQTGQRLVPKHVNLNALLAELQPQQALTVANLQARREALTRDPSAEGWITLSLLQYQAGDYQGAVESSQAALGLQPDSPQAHNNLCVAYLQLGRLEEAVKAGEEAVRRDPQSERARNNLAWARQELAKKAPSSQRR